MLSYDMFSTFVFGRRPPDVGLAPSAAWRALPLQPPVRRLPQASPAKRARGGGGWGEEGGRVVREGLRLEGRVLQLPWRGHPPKGSWGQTHIWGALNLVMKGNVLPFLGVLFFLVFFSNQGHSLLSWVFLVTFISFCRLCLGSEWVKNPWCLGLFSLVFFLP